MVAFRAEVAELADAPALGAGGRKAIGVRVPSSAPNLLFREMSIACIPILARSLHNFACSIPRACLTMVGVGDVPRPDAESWKDRISAGMKNWTLLFLASLLL